MTRSGGADVLASGASEADSDIFAGQPGDPSKLAEVYDLEHDEIDEDLTFYREWTRRQPGDVVDLGCGSGRLFGAFLAGGARRIVGVDGSAVLLRRAEDRIAADPVLWAARDEGRVELVVGDVRRVTLPHRFGLAILAGVLSHLGGPRDAVQALRAAAALLDGDGVLIVDLLGPGGVPTRNLPPSVDWEREIDGVRVVRRSHIERHADSDGVRVAYHTLTDLGYPTGTIARLPATFRLWYPSPVALLALAREAGLTVVATYGSHELDPLVEGSDRCIAVLRRATATPGKG